METSSIINRLEEANNNIVRQICEISGVPGMSVGVMYRGEVVYRHNLGVRNVKHPVPSTPKTIYCIGSLTKAFTAAAVANVFRDQIQTDWDTPVTDIIPGFKPSEKVLRGLISTADFMSHRSGLFGDLSFALQGNLEFLLPPEELIPTVNELQKTKPFRQSWMYNNWGYSMAGCIVEKLSGKPFADYLHETILKPLSLTHTTSKPRFDEDDNFADAHVALRDSRPYLLPRTFLFKDSIFESAGGIYSNVDDLLHWAKAILRAEKQPTKPLWQVPTLISNQIPLDNPSRDFRFYGMGWIRTQLPGVVGLQGDNADILEKDELPILGAGAQPMITYYHQGSAPGYYSAIFLFPESESAIVVLTNSMPLNDAADWIAQTYISALFDFPNPADYEGLARESCKRKVEKCDAVLSNMNKMRRDHAGDKPQPLAAYAGRYYNRPRNFLIEIRQHTEDASCLELRFQGKESQSYNLRYLYGNVFEWAMTFDEAAKKARAANWDLEYFKLHFIFGEEQHAVSLTWAAFKVDRPEGILMQWDNER
ncbi:penicillin-binding protein [Xylariaceae sp. FL1651]|nr:penicillin-binding protein [Xylariaceae sp. FL1651]